MDILEEKVVNIQGESPIRILLRRGRTTDQGEMILATEFVREKSVQCVFQITGDESCQFVHGKSDSLPTFELLSKINDFGYQVQNIPSVDEENDSISELLDAIQRYMELAFEECVKHDHELILKSSAKYAVKQVRNHREYLKLYQNPDKLSQSDVFDPWDEYPPEPEKLLKSILNE